MVYILHAHLEFLVGFFCWCGFFYHNFIKFCFDARINFGIIKKVTGDDLDAASNRFVYKSGGGWSCWLLGRFSAIDWCVPGMTAML